MKWVLRILGVLIALLVIAFVFFRTPDTDAAEMRVKYGSEPSQFVELSNGMIVHLRDEGPRDGLPVILLHGSNADLHTWQLWAEALRNEYRVIRFDQRGHGLTGSAVDDDYTLDGFTSDVGLVADALGLEQFVLGGNSMGGWISAGYSLENEDRLAGLMLVDSSGAPVKREGSTPIGFRIAQTPVLRDLAKYFMPRSIFENSLKQSVSNQEIVTEAEVDRYWEMARYPGNRDATMKRFRTPRVTYNAEQVAGLDLPVLVMWGEEDALTAVTGAHWYSEHLPSDTLVIYEGVGHLPQQEHAEQSAADVLTWLGTLSGSVLEEGGVEEPVG
ncbi:MAG: alpha/beta hydrolase [Altererythrobacter sp.]|nr:alpha/beta hydrolase [Altererythrobacter sp.]